MTKGKLWILRKIDLDFLEDNFYQPFSELPTECEAVDQKVQQMRLVIEVLRRYLEKNPPETSAQQQLSIQERDYRQLAYTTLLEQIGTTYEELQDSRLMSDADKQAIADGIGIPVAYLYSLLLTPEANTVGKFKLNGSTTSSKFSSYRYVNRNCA